MKREQAQEFTEALGLVIGGAARLAEWAPEVGIPEALGLSPGEWAERRLAGQIRLTREERRRVVEANPDMSTRQLGEALDVGHATIARDRLALEPVSSETEDASCDAASRDPAVSDETPDEPGNAKTDSAATGALLVASDENEWYTPAKYIEAARRVMGGIDLDPATSPLANRTVRAGAIWTQDDDGLAQPWHGRIWLNPPYGGIAQKFITRLIAEHASGTVTAAIALINAHCTDTNWFQPLWDQILCFTDHRIDFHSAGRDKKTSSTHGSVFAYLGPDPEAFAATFSHFGPIVRRWAP